MASSVSAAATSRLMESGLLPPVTNQAQPQIVRRGMAVHTSDACQAGYVAAVMVDCNTHQISHLLLVQPCQPFAYRLLPVAAVTAVSEAAVTLDVALQGITALPRWATT